MNAETTYLFRHALLRDAAYELQLPAERAYCHESAVAALLAVHKRAQPESLAGELADHAGRALEQGADNAFLRECRERYLHQAMHAAAAGFRTSEAIRRAEELVALPWAGAKRRIEALVLAAEFCQRSGQGQRAAGHIRKALRLLEKAPDPKRTYQAHMLLAIDQIHRGQYAAAEASLQKLLASGVMEKQSRRYCVAVGNLAIVHREIGRNREAEQEFRQVIERLNALGDGAEEGRNLGNLANLLRDQGHHTEAESAYLRALELVREQGASFTEGIILGNYAEQLLQLGRHGQARAVIAQAQAVHHRTADTVSSAECASHLARVLAAEGNVEAAASMSRQAIETLGNAGMRLLAAAARFHLARFLFDAGRMAESATELDVAESELEAIGAREMLLCHASPLRAGLLAAGGADQAQRQKIKQLLMRTEAELERLGHVAGSAASRQLAACRALCKATKVDEWR